MTGVVPHGRLVLTSDEAAGYAAMLARVQVVGCYPITPQTIIVERLAELAAGHREIEFTTLESEHSMVAYVVAAARMGVRTFTATSSQGLLYAHEQLHRAGRERIPLVMVDINRAVMSPWSLEADHSDAMSQRDTAWIHLHCSSAQEVLDTVLCAYRIAETAMLPVMVCAEGFLLSHTAEVLEVPSQAQVDAFLPPFQAPADWVLDPDRPRAMSGLPEARDYAAFQRGVADAMDASRDTIEAVAAEFTAAFGRTKVGALQVAGDPRAEHAIVAIGTIADTALELLEDDPDLLVVRVHAFRPFPSAALAAALERCGHVSVVDRAAAFGSLGPLGAEVRALELGHDRRVADFVCGVGGTDVTPDTLRWILEETRMVGERRASRAPVWVPEGAQP